MVSVFELYRCLHVDKYETGLDGALQVTMDVVQQIGDWFKPRSHITPNIFKMRFLKKRELSDAGFEPSISQR